MVSIIIQAGLFIKEIGKMIYSKEKVKNYFQISHFIKELSSKERNLVKEFSLSQMAQNMKENSKIINLMD